MATVKRRRLKFVEAIPQHALHLKGLRGPHCARYVIPVQTRSRHRCAQMCRLAHTCASSAGCEEGGIRASVLSSTSKLTLFFSHPALYHHVGHCKEFVFGAKRPQLLAPAPGLCSGSAREEKRQHSANSSSRRALPSQQARPYSAGTCECYLSGACVSDVGESPI